MSSTRWVQVPRRRRTKLVAALDLASCNETTVQHLLTGGANLVVIPLPIDAASRDAATAAYQAVRTTAHNARNPIGIIADLAGQAPEEDAAVGGGELEQGLGFLAALGVDYVVVPGTADVSIEQLRSWLPDHGMPGILVRISEAPALERAEALIAAADGVVVDLDGSIAVEDGHVVRRRLLRLANQAATPCLLAGRSADAASAVLTGADGLVLSPAAWDEDALAELTHVDQSTRRLEADLAGDPTPLAHHDLDLVWSVDAALVRAAVQLAHDGDARALVVLPSPTSCHTAQILSAARPRVPIVALAPSLPDMLHMSILWGVTPRWVRPDELANLDDRGIAGLVETVAGQLGVASPGDLVVTVDGCSAEDHTSARRLEVVTLATN